MRYRVTLRGNGTELRGYATADALAQLSTHIHPETAVVVASPADDDYDPFKVDVLNDAQRAKVILLKGDPMDFRPVFDLPEGWVAGWANGAYYGIDPDGDASS